MVGDLGDGRLEKGRVLGESGDGFSYLWVHDNLTRTICHEQT